MAVTCLPADGFVHIPVIDLARYAYPKENPALLTKQYGFSRDAVYEGFDDDTAPSPMSKSPRRKVLLEITTHYDNIPVSVSGTADIVAFDGLSHTVETVKTKSFLPYNASPFDDPAAVAQTVCLAHMLASSQNLPMVRVRITFAKRGGDDRLSFVASFSAKILRTMFDALIDRAAPFLKILWERATALPDEIVGCPFPFRSVRDGQRDFVTETFRAVKNGGKLFVSAPTGIGKTMASIYPAVKGLGIGAVDKIFYLTSKTVTGLAALDAARSLNAHIPHLRAVLLSAKEAQCPNRTKKQDRPPVPCALCGNLREIYDAEGDFLSYPERQNNALLSLLYADDRIYTTERIRETAAAFSVCPHELSLDLSLYCDLIVCDYNYAYDDAVRFHRYFKSPETQHQYVFLIDEAHNLPDRVRDMYSATVSTELLDKLLHICRGGEAEIPTLYGVLTKARAYLDTMGAMCTEGAHVSRVNGVDLPCGYCKSGVLDEEFTRIFTNLATALSKEVNGMGDYAAELAPYKNQLRKAAFVCNRFTDRFCFFAERIGEEVCVDLLCLDPSEIIAEMDRSAKAVIRFSATLSPMEYYKTVCGCKKAAELDLPSPYDRKNFCPIVYDSISTRFNDRKDNACETAEVIAEAISAKEGNYMVYFSSYAHMKQVVRPFSEMMPAVTLVMQKSGMSFRERERFLSVFGDKRYRNVVGFCVLGGMFSEGIDLAGDRLIGAIIVGTGLPGLSARRNIMMEHYDKTTERGREFAYVFPGMNKVLQAAGRVIRSESDRGMVLLIDDRYGEPETKRLLPPHWRHLQFTGDVQSLAYILSDFWEKTEE